MKLKDKTPEIYHNLFGDILELSIPEEKIATCSSCTFCQKKNSPLGNYKCCTYFPIMSNYLLGGILSDDKLKVGAKNIEQIISSRKGVTPYAIFPNINYSNLRQKEVKKDFLSFVKNVNPELLCPYYDNGDCSVWKYRENLCITFFCSSVGGSSGTKFWSKYNNLLKKAEHHLSLYALTQLGFRAEKISLNPFNAFSFATEDEKGIIDLEKYKRLWGDWYDNELEFYKRSFELINKLDSERFIQLLGQDFDITSQAVKNTLNEFHECVYPDYLILDKDIEKEYVSQEIVVYRLNGNEVEINRDMEIFLNFFNGQRKTNDIIKIAIAVFLSLNSILDQLLDKKMILKVDK